MEITVLLHVGDVVEMRKVHPCGATQWEINRVGADIGLTCAGCGRRVMLTRRDFAKGARRFVSRGRGAAENDSSPGSEPGPGARE